MVQYGTVKAMNVECSLRNKPLFCLSIADSSGRERCVKTPRVVCAFGPIHSDLNIPWSYKDLMNSVTTQFGGKGSEERICHTHQVIPRLLSLKSHFPKTRDVLIVGGGITSAHLAIVASREKAWNITLLQRSPTKSRQFDLDTKCNGPTGWFRARSGRS